MVNFPRGKVYLQPNANGAAAAVDSRRSHLFQFIEITVKYPLQEHLKPKSKNGIVINADPS